MSGSHGSQIDKGFGEVETANTDMNWTEFRAWCKSIGLYLPVTPAQAATYFIPDVEFPGMGNHRVYDATARRAARALVKLRALCTVTNGRESGSSTLITQAVHLAARHTEGVVWISDGVVGWTQNPTPEQWSTIISQGVIAIPCVEE